MAAAPLPQYILRSASEISSVHHVAFSNVLPFDSLVSCHQNGNVHIWRLDWKRQVHSVVFPKSESSAAIFSHIVENDDIYLCVQKRSGFLYIYGISSQSQSHPNAKEKYGTEIPVSTNLISSFDTKQSGFCKCSVLSNPPFNYSMIAYASNLDENILSVVRYQFPSTWEDICQVPTDENSSKHGMAMVLVFHIINTLYFVICGFEDGTVSIINVEQEAVVSSFKPYTDTIMCLSISKSNVGFCGSVTDQLICFNVDDSLTLHQCAQISITNPGVSAIAASPNEKIVVFGGWDNRLRVFGVKKFKPLAVLMYHRASIQAINFNNQGLFASGCSDGQIAVWDVYR